MQETLQLSGEHSPLVRSIALSDIIPGKQPTQGQAQALADILTWLDIDAGRRGWGAPERPFKRSDIPASIADWFGDNPNEYFILRGFAGVGKTVLVCKLIVELSKLGWSIAVSAPTNKAVSVLAEKVKEYARDQVVCAVFKSIHSFVGLRMVESDDGELKIAMAGAASLHEYDLVIMDEASMADTANIFTSIASNRGNSRILGVGDPCQLQPVNEGRVSRIFDMPQGSELRTVTRQAAGNPLIAASMQVRKLIDAGDYDAVTASDLEVWLPGSRLHGSRSAMVDKVIELQRAGKDARILAYRNQVVLEINDMVHYELYPSAPHPFSPGEKVIVQSTCSALEVDTGKRVELVTSEELLVVECEEERNPDYPNVHCHMLTLRDVLGRILLTFVPSNYRIFGNRCRDMFTEVEDLKRRRAPQHLIVEARNRAWAFKKAFCEIRHTYASTIHKSQGSTYDVAIIALQDVQGMRSTAEYNRAIYVAMTRPREYALFSY